MFLSFFFLRRSKMVSSEKEQETLSLLAEDIMNVTLSSLS